MPGTSRAVWIAAFAASAVLGALISGPAAGAEPAFSFVDLAYVKAEHGEGGGRLRGSGAIGERWLWQGTLDVQDYRDGGVVLSSLGFGAHWPITPSLQMVFGLSAELVGGSHDGNDGMGDGGIEGGALGAGAGLELRSRVGERLELQAGAKFDSVTSNVTTSLGGRYYFTNRLAAGIDVSNNYFGTHVGLAVRFDLQRR